MGSQYRITKLGLVVLLCSITTVSCDITDSLLAPGTRNTDDVEAPEIVTDEFGAEYVKNQFTVAYKPGISRSTIQEFADSLGDEVRSYTEELSWVHINSSRPENQVESDWNEAEWTRVALRDYVLKITDKQPEENYSTTNSYQYNNYNRNRSQSDSDPRLEEQWGIHRINATQIWKDYGKDGGRGGSAKVGIIDSPWYNANYKPFDPTIEVPEFSTSHEDFKDAWDDVIVEKSDSLQIIQYQNICDQSQYSYAECWGIRMSHATHVGGIIGARSNDKGISGTAPKSKLFPLQEYVWVDMERFHSSIKKLTKNNVDVINISMGSKITKYHVHSDSIKTLWSDALAKALKDGVLIVNSAGNDSTLASRDLFHSTVAEQPNGIVVGASDSLNMRSDFSNYGIEVEIYAPGSSILSTVPCKANKSCTESGYAYAWGTSMAAPFVTGAAALIYSIGEKNFNETPSPVAVKDALIEGSKNGGISIDNNGNRVPLLNAYEAVKYYLRNACRNYDITTSQNEQAIAACESVAPAL